MAIDSLYTAVGFFPITKSDTKLPERPRAVYVGTQGNLVIKGVDDVTVTLVDAVGELNISPTHILTTTTAADIVGYR
jgi:hypothetical protein